MKITSDPAKRQAALRERGLNFADAAVVFAGPTITVQDTRRDYGEARYQTVGFLADRMVMVVWTPRGEARHIISMRKCNDREKANYQERFGQS
ncbi:MAG: BrnT family toxin [Alphaproteobacteria bacterium]|nr:MAG: BrnT family toxin [Alphaproteobacteria bacterium]